MRRIAMLVTTLATAVALAVPVAGQAANAAPVKSGAGHSAKADAAHKPKKGKKGKKNRIKLKTSAPGAQPGIGGTKVKATKLKTGGKVKFTLNGAKLGKAKVKKGKATFTLPALGTGTYEIKAKLGKQKGKTSFRVYQSALTLNATSFTICKAISAACSASVNQTMNGTVLFKDQTPNKGYVDIYPVGAAFGSANTITFAGVGAADITPQPAGTFTFQRGGAGTTNSFLSDVRSEYAPGTYTFQAFYTETPSYAEYIASNLITVVVNP